jgi:hypothetical protein
MGMYMERGDRTNHVSHELKPKPDGNIPMNFKSDVIMDRRSKYWKKAIKQLKENRSIQAPEPLLGTE